MSAQPKQSKVLRIGIIQDGKIVQERLVKAGDPVTIGTGPKNSFPFPPESFDREAFTLFDHRDGQYVLRFTEAMKGKIRSRGAALALAKARAEGGIAQSAQGDADSAGVWELPLEEQDRGKLAVGTVNILFQFVAPPPVQAPTPMEKMDFRPRWVEDDDPIFLAFLALWSALGLAFGIWVFTADPPEISIDEIPDRFTRIVIDKPPEEPVEDDDEEEPELGVDEKKKVAKKKTATEKVAEKVPAPGDGASKGEKAQAVEDAKDQLMKESALFKQMQIIGIGTLGESERTILQENTVGSASDIEGKLQEAADAVAEIGDGSRIRGGAKTVGGTGARDVGELKEGEVVGEVAVGTGPKVKEPEGRVSSGSLDFDGGDVSSVGKVVRRYQGQLKYCYDSQLKKNPSLSGKVVVGFEIEAEELVDVWIVTNETGDSEFADCIERKVRRWKFDGVDDGSARAPFVFEPEG